MAAVVVDGARKGCLLCALPSPYDDCPAELAALASVAAASAFAEGNDLLGPGLGPKDLSLRLTQERK